MKKWEVQLIRMWICAILLLTDLNSFLFFIRQVANYGMGGHYETHFDFGRVSFIFNLINLYGEKDQRLLLICYIYLSCDFFSVFTG